MCIRDRVWSKPREKGESKGARSNLRGSRYGLNTSGNPARLEDLAQDLANFLLVRGDYAYLGHGWLGCSKFYHFPPELNADYGTPTGLCSETAAGSGVFVREWTRSTVQMDCNSWTPTITMKS